MVGELEKKAFTPGCLEGITLRNRVIRTAAFEGMCQEGVPTDSLIEHHRAAAAGGVAMTTVAYCSVSGDGRTYGHQMHIRPEIVPGLERLTRAVHGEGAMASIQLGHSGYFASASVIGQKPIGASRVFNMYGLSFARPMTEADVNRVTDDFGTAAHLAAEAGFDAVELHAGHGYLLSQFLSPHTNRRSDHLGGSLENRMRFPIAVLERVREVLGPGYPVLVKMNLEDGFRGGLEIDEAIEVAKRLESSGASALVLSGGFVSKSSLYMMRGHVPVREMAAVQDSRLRKAGLLLFGHIFVKTYPFEELFFLEKARMVRAEVGLPLVLVGGIVSLENMKRAMAEGFDFLAMGRALIRDPDLLKKMQRGEMSSSDCDHCNRCIAEMDRGGVRCVTER